MISATQNHERQETNSHLEQFEKLEAEAYRAPSWIFPIRKAAIARFAEIGYPTTQDEDWRYTNVAPITKLPFKPALENPRQARARKAVQRATFSNLTGSRLVFVDGHYSDELSVIDPLLKEGVRIGSLAHALQNADETIAQSYLARHASIVDSAFTALNTAFFQDGAFVLVPANVRLEEPVRLIFVSTGAEPGVTAHPRNLIIADRHSQATILETYIAISDASYVTNAVTEMIAGEGAVVEHCKFQDESTEAFHIAALHAHLGANSRYSFHSIASGGRLSRNNIRTVLAGSGVDCVLNGLYLTKAEQVADHHMVVDHAQPHCNSHEYFNGILDGRSRGVFHGRILVRPDAQKTDAKQTNKNLLLSDDATANAKPQLEIYADDVKCTHGATIGQLNEDSIFYLQARGIGIETARRMLIHAFAGEIIDRVQFGPAREELNQLVWDWLEENPHVAETAEAR